MKILFASPDLPSDRGNGSTVRSAQIWRALTTVGEVDVLQMVRGPETKLVSKPEESIGRIEFASPAMPWQTSVSKKVSALIDQATECKEYDVVVARYLRLGLFFGKKHSRVILDGDDLRKHQSQFRTSFKNRLKATLEQRARLVLTKMALPRFDHVWYVNARDQATFRARAGSLLPNVITIPEVVPELRTSEPLTAVMVGNFAFEPNHMGAQFFIDQVLPRLLDSHPTFSLDLVGKVPDEVAKIWRQKPGLRLRGFVNELVDAYSDAQVVIAPIFSGGGSQIKVIEGLSYARPVVASPFAVSGFAPHLLPEQHLLQADKPEEWAHQVVRLVENPKAAEAIGLEGRKVVQSEFSYEKMRFIVSSTLS